MSAADLFGDRANEYARHRPTYPEALFDHLERWVPGRDAAWDCGAGSGQTARSLAKRFRLVVATDLSERQLAQGAAVDHVAFVAATAEAAPLRERCADLVTVSAALHWFDRPRFYDEMRRVARPGAILAVWSYYHSRIEPAIDAVLVHVAEQIVGPYWIPGFDLNRQLYRDLDLPFERLPWPEVNAEARMRLPDLVQYMRTWSASQAYERARGADPVAAVRDDLVRAWGDEQTERVIRWPLHGAIGRVSRAT
jgi:ubiquinone/menaquinone biosynthesis C-methylase UbiE